MTIPKTPRLTKLETNAHELPPHWTGHNVHGLVAGYKQAQADYQPVIDAVRASQTEQHEHYCCPETPCPLCQTIRDALAGLEGK